MTRLPFRLLLLLALGSTLLTSPATAAPYFVQCYDFGCKTQRELRFDEQQWDEIKALFENGIVDSATEKQAIRRAVAMMERMSGEQTDTHLDQGGNYPGSDIPGQMDCIDESIKTTCYLQLFATYGGLRWHRVSDRVVRAPLLFDLHWAGLLVERATQQHYVVDSWYLDNGGLPYIQPLEEWRGKQPFKQAATGVLDDV